jgi:hypothetical protein
MVYIGKTPQGFFSSRRGSWSGARDEHPRAVQSFGVKRRSLDGDRIYPSSRYVGRFVLFVSVFQGERNRGVEPIFTCIINDKIFFQFFFFFGE